MGIHLAAGLRAGRACAVAAAFWVVAAGMFAAADVKIGDVVEARLRASTLRTEIARHDELYFKHAAPEISDEAYDRLKRELASLERAFPELKGNARGSEGIASPLGDDRSGRFPTARHGEPMLSLEKAYTQKELKLFLQRAVLAETAAGPAQWLVEPKYDGVAISATYQRGRLLRVVTRGDGREGDDVTANALTLCPLPREFAGGRDARDEVGVVPELIELRGEVFISFAEFERINRERDAAGEPLFANPRNLAAGTLKSSDAAAIARRKLSVVFHGWGAVQPLEAAPATQQAFSVQLRAWGLPAVEGAHAAGDSEEVWLAVQKLGRARKELPFPTDGVVVKLNPVSPRAKIGATDQAPRWAVAYKFAAGRAETRVVAISLQIGRTGVLTPVAELEPVSVGGSMVTRATLHNREEISRRDLRVGDVVSIEKAGEIIPAVVSVDRARRSAGSVPFAFPEHCPVCREALANDGKEAAVRCPNRACAGQVEARVRHFASEACVEIGGLGEKTVAALVASGRVRNVADLYRLTREDLLAHANVGVAGAETLLREIEASKRAELWRVVHGLGLPGVGAVTARKLAAAYPSLEAIAQSNAAEFQTRAGLGTKTARELETFFRDAENRTLVATLRDLGLEPRKSVSPPVQSGGHGALALAGKTFVFTGTLKNFTRAEAGAMIVAAGGTVSDSLSAQTSYVVVGENPGAKLARARELGVGVLDEADFAALLRLASERVGGAEP